MAGLISVGRHLPDTVPVARLQEPLGMTDAQVRRFTRLYGLGRICQAPARSEADLLCAAVSGLLDFPALASRIRWVIRANGLRTTAPYPHSPVHEACRRLGLRDATVLSVADHGCATGLLALDVASTLLAADPDPDALALVLAGDKTATPFTQWVADVSIMGEGFAAALLSAHSDRDRIVGYAATVHGRADGLIDMTPELAKVAKVANKIYQDTLFEVITEAVEAAGITVADLALVLPHNVNRVSWTVASAKLGISQDTLLLDNIECTGHCFCADPLINYRTAVAGQRLRPGDHYLMTSAGLGQAFGAMVLRH